MTPCRIPPALLVALLSAAVLLVRTVALMLAASCCRDGPFVPFAARRWA